MANSQRVVVVSKPLRVQAFLRDELGLTPEILRGGLEEGIAAAALCTRHHPPNFGGLRLWAEAVRSLRDQLAPLGWHRDDSFNYSTVVRDDGALGRSPVATLVLASMIVIRRPSTARVPSRSGQSSTRLALRSPVATLVLASMIVIRRPSTARVPSRSGQSSTTPSFPMITFRQGTARNRAPRHRRGYCCIIRTAPRCVASCRSRLGSMSRDSSRGGGRESY